MIGSRTWKNVAGLVLAVLLGGGFWVSVSERPSAADESGKVLRHVVMFQFKESSSADEVQKVVEEFRALPKKIPQIADFEYGTDNSPEGLAAGFTHCFLVTFRSEKDREAYLPHAAHLAFVEVLKPHLEKVMVIDYWASK
ncbi:MAG: Dabb family protein [Planctomycetales bacterium]|nr:Dabb family protein [Planctomycetales bacterium]